MALLLALLLGDDLDTLRKRFEEERDKPYAQRHATVSKIGALKSDEAALFLISVFESDKDDSIRCCALSALGSCGTEKATAKLTLVVRDESAPLNHRSAALFALAQGKSKRALDQIVSIVRKRDLKNALRLSAYHALQGFPLGQTEPLWREALSDPEPNIQAQALRALAPRKDSKVLEAARRVLEDAAAIPYLKTAAVEPWKVAGGPEAVRVFLAAAGSSDCSVRRALLDALSACADDPSIEVLYLGLRSSTVAVRELVTRSLGKLKHPRVLEHLEIALKDKEVSVRVAAIEALAERKDPKGESLFHREAQGSEEEVAVAAIGAMASVPSAETIGLLLKLTEGRTLRIRVAALAALGDLRATEALGAFRKAIRAAEWPVRAAAIRSFAKLRGRESVDSLIERMGKESGRLRADIEGALRELTGKDLGFEPGHWKDWWNANRETFVFPKEGAAPGGGATGTSYFGVPVISKRMIFCLDISGSMSESSSGKGTRLDTAKRELGKVLTALAKDAWVNLIFFDHQIEPWRKQLVPIGPSLPKALTRIRSLQPRGGTNIYDALERAFADPNVDTIYLLSDGSPGVGKFTASDDILREVRRMNQPRQIAVHTVSIGASDFMKKLAEENGGCYAEVK